MNLNEYVEVILTTAGANIYNSRWDGIVLPKKFEVKIDYVEGDYLKTQLWDLMSIFGPHIDMGCQVPFVNNEMKICSK